MVVEKNYIPTAKNYAHLYAYSVCSATAKVYKCCQIFSAYIHIII